MADKPAALSGAKQDTRVDLDVPCVQKDHANATGARWDRLARPDTSAARRAAAQRVLREARHGDQANPPAPPVHPPRGRPAAPATARAGTLPRGSRVRREGEPQPSRNCRPAPATPGPLEAWLAKPRAMVERVRYINACYREHDDRFYVLVDTLLLPDDREQLTVSPGSLVR
jgi:hypothetical protein